MLPMGAQILPALRPLDVAASASTPGQQNYRQPQSGCQFPHDEATTAHARGSFGKLQQSPGCSPAPFRHISRPSYAFLLPCTCLLFVRSTLCVSLVPVATKDSCWVQKMVTYTSWCCPRNLVTSVSRRRIYCVALSNEMSTRGLEFAHES